MQVYSHLLDSNFSIPVINIETKHGKAKLSLFGAQLLSFNNGLEKIWLSESAILDGSKAIRGGVPVCWPWFGDKANCRSHGFARESLWIVTKLEESEQKVMVEMQLPISTHQDFAYNFSLTARFELTDKLSISLTTTNNGEQAFEITAALHSYLAVGSVTKTEIKGLSDTDYQDKLDSLKHKPTPSPYFITQLSDRIHRTRETHLALLTPKQQIQLSQQGHDSIVVWNPWEQGSAVINDMGNGGYRSMLCVEAAVTTPFRLLPGQQHSLIQTIK